MLNPRERPSTATPSVIHVLTPLTEESFANAYADRVHRFAAMVMKNSQDSSDLAQEALLKAMHGLSRFDQRRGTLDAWVWRIVINTARDTGRATRRRTALHERLFANHERTSNPNPVEMTVLNRLRDGELVAAVRRLPVRPRTIIALRFGAQLSNLEIADHLDMRPRAVSMALHRALARLHRDLEAQT